jgi:hypothetical protein
MAHDVEKLRFDDLFGCEEWPLFSARRTEFGDDSAPRLTVICFEADGIWGVDSSINLKRDCVQAAIKWLRQLPAGGAEAKMWLFVAHWYWLPQNRITHYKRLWKSNDAARLPLGPRSAEVSVSHEKGIRFAGTLQLATKDISSVIWDETSFSTAVIVSRRDLGLPEEIHRLFASAFPGGQGNVDWAGLAATVGPLGDILIRGTIEKDGMRPGVDCFFVAELVEGNAS